MLDDAPPDIERRSLLRKTLNIASLIALGWAGACVKQLLTKPRFTTEDGEEIYHFSDLSDGDTLVGRPMMTLGDKGTTIISRIMPENGLRLQVQDRVFDIQNHFVRRRVADCITSVTYRSSDEIHLCSKGRLIPGSNVEAYIAREEYEWLLKVLAVRTDFSYAILVWGRSSLTGKKPRLCELKVEPATREEAIIARD